MLMAQDKIFDIQKQPVFQSNGVAINGYDPVSYFTDNKAIQGNNVYTCEWNKTTWHFSSEEHRDLFIKDPTRYAPQYGGYCAHAIASNKLVESNPQSFIVKDEKLYLYQDEKSKKIAQFNFKKIKKQSDKNWLKFGSQF